MYRWVGPDLQPDDLNSVITVTHGDIKCKLHMRRETSYVASALAEPPPPLIPDADDASVAARFM